MERYYKILGLKPGADLNAIKKAYRRMAMKYHPDKYDGDDSKFLQILEAYEFLTKLKTQPRSTPEGAYTYADLQAIYDLLQKAAQERARKKAEARAAYYRRKREEEQEKSYRQAVNSLIAIIAIVAAGFFGYRGVKYLVINQNKVETPVMITGLGRHRVHYKFYTNGEWRHDEAYVSAARFKMLAGNGMPLAKGDEFKIAFNPESPAFHEIKYNKASESTIQRYLRLSQTKLFRIYRKEWSDLSRQTIIERSRCMAFLVYDRYGIEGLSAIYFHDENPLANFSNNRWSWYFFSRDDQYRDIKNICKEKYNGTSAL